ncbi:MAG: DegT/DnrJ/EryC1/StrS family aminotransferase [Actinomycetota bacterium]
MTQTADGTVLPRIPFGSTTLSPDVEQALSQVLRSGWLTTGPQVAGFEKDIAAFVGAPHAVAVSSCTAAIELAIRALRLRPGAKVLTSANTFCGAVNAIVHAGARPVLADVDADTLMPNVRTVADAARAADGVDGMVVLHFAGYPAPVRDLADAAGLPMTRVVEDAAHALGAIADDETVGTISAATCFSFYATKNLPIGEGGMIATADDEIADFVRRTRLHGMSKDAWKRYLPGEGWRYGVEDIGLKANMTDLQAGIGRAQLQEFPRWQHRRAALAERYDAQLAGIPGLRIPARPMQGQHAWHLYVVRVEERFGLDRDAVMASLSDAGIDASVHFIPVHHLSAYRRLLDGNQPGLHTVDAAFETYLSLPLHQGLDDSAIDRVSEVLRDLQRSSAGPPRDRTDAETHPSEVALTSRA